MTRSWSTLLCLRLCSSAWGTPFIELVMNTAVPGTRVALVAADLMNTSIGRLASFIRSIISLRPLAQVVSKVKAMAPTSSGNQPPSGTFSRLAREIERRRR